MKNYLLLSSLFFFQFAFSQPNNNGVIDNPSEFSKRETIFLKAKDGTKLATEIYLPVFQDSVVTMVNIGGVDYPIQLIPKHTQYIVYDTANFNKNNLRLPIIFNRTPYNASSDEVGGVIFPFLGYGYATQDMRGRYASEGVYFPMISDSWKKNKYMPNDPLPMDLYPTSSLSNALQHEDGSESVYGLSDSAVRVFDYDLNGILDTFMYSNKMIGMYGASAVGNSQYQALSNIPFVNSNPLKCLMPVVATNEHYNTTLFHNGVFRHSLVTGWITGQLSVMEDSLNAYDFSIGNTVHSPSDYGYATKAALTQDLLDWYVSTPVNGGPSGAHPSSMHRKILDASQTNINSSGQSDSLGTLSRYRNMNVPMYNLTGWWDIFINGQIETFNRTRAENPNSMQKLIIGPWTHQTIGSNQVGDVTYPLNVQDVLGIDVTNVDPQNLLSDPNLASSLFTSEMLTWYRTHLGGEPFFFIPESSVWQNIGSNQLRIPAKNYFVPYTDFINFIGGQSNLPNLPIEMKIGSVVTPLQYSVPPSSPPLLQLSSPIPNLDLNYFNNTADVRVYVSGPTNDVQNPNVGNQWISIDSFPFKQNVTNKRLYLHQNHSLDTTTPVSNEGALSYVNDPNHPVATIGGNNMIVTTPLGNNSQGSMDYTNPVFAPITMNRSDVLQFESALTTDTLSIIGFPKASIYVKANSSNTNLSQTDFDVMLRILDVYPDGREMFITEGTVNARARQYAKSIYDGAEDNASILSNVNNDTYYYLQFDMLPIAHTFGKDHKIKVLLSSSNFPKYQSNPQIPIETNQFFRWEPGSSKTHMYQGNPLSASSSTITYDFVQNSPNFIELPVCSNFPLASVAESHNENHELFDFYPNPTFNTLTIKFNNETTSTVKVFDLSGKLLITKKFSNAIQTQIDMSKLSAGAYVLSVDNFESKKLIVKQ